MSQLARLISILTLLKSKRIITATELSDKYDVSIRTIYRDIKKLEEANVPIITLEGRGYTLMDGYTLAPVQFTQQQANALITAEHLINQTNDSSLISNFKEALTKIKSVFKTSILERSEVLNKRLLVFKGQQEEFSSHVLSEIQLAITNLTRVEIQYHKLNADNNSIRKIDPCAIYSAENKWILLAWCHLRNDYRAFRIDRIKRFKILDESFEDRNFDIRKYFLSCPEINYNP